MPVVGNNLILTPTWIKLCNKIIEILPIKTSFILLSFFRLIFWMTLYDRTKYIRIIPITIIAPNSSAITETI